MSGFSNVKAALHPLAIASACDHFTRVSSGGSKIAPTAPIYGLLFGSISHCVEANGIESWIITISDATDAIYTVDSNDEVNLLFDAVKTRCELWTTVFTELHLVGWYTFGDGVEEKHQVFQKSVEYLISQNQHLVHSTLSSVSSSFNTSDADIDSVGSKKFDPVFVLMRGSDIDAKPISTANDEDEVEDNIPLKVYQYQIMNPNSNKRVFVELQYSMETTVAEQVAVDNIIKSIPPPHGMSEVEVHNESLITSLNIFKRKIKLMVDTLKEIEKGIKPFDHNLIRTAGKVARMINIVAAEEVHGDGDFLSSIIESMATLTATLNSLKRTAEMYTTAFGDTESFMSSKLDHTSIQR